MTVLSMSIYSITVDVIDSLNNDNQASDNKTKDRENKKTNGEGEEEINNDSNASEEGEPPIVNIIERTVECRYLDEYDVYSNIEVIYDGEYTKSWHEKQIGEDDNDHEITITIKANNGKEISASYNLHETKTEGKDIFIIGDSIVKGFGADNTSFADYIGENYDFIDYYKCGNNDYRLSTFDDPNKWLVTAGSQYLNDEKYDFDYIVIEGGINDVFYDTPLGEIDDKTEGTFTGGLRLYLDAITQRWPKARIGYLITYYPINYSENGKTWSEEEYKAYHDRTIEILKEYGKYGIDYLDLSEDKYEVLDAGNKTYLPDYLHPNEKGHKMIAEWVFDWVEDLKPYER